MLNVWNRNSDFESEFWFAKFESEFLIFKVWNRNFWFWKHSFWYGSKMFDFEFCNHKFMIWNHNFYVSTRFANLKSQFPILKQRFWFGITISFWNQMFLMLDPWSQSFWWSNPKSKVLKQKWQKGETYITIVFFSAPTCYHAMLFQSIVVNTQWNICGVDWTSWTESFWFQIPKQKFWNKSGIRAKTKLHYVFFLRLRRGEMKHDIMFMSVLCLVFHRCQHVVASGISLNRNSRWKNESQFHPVSSGLI